MKITVNGEQTEVKDRVTVSELLTEQNVKMSDMVSVELNSNILKRNFFDTTALEENDQVEFMYFMGGGANPVSYVTG